MGTGSWFRTHRRQVAIHSCVIAGFLVFTLFAAAPLFDRLERVAGEAQLVWMSLPAETGDIMCNIERLSSGGGATVDIEGWAFIQGYDADTDDTTTYIVLRSETSTYVFDTFPWRRSDVNAHFQELGLNVEWAGFRAFIPLRKVDSGEYTVGIYIRKGDVEALQYTDSRVEI